MNQETLLELMQEEVFLLREILSLMIQEEKALLEGDHQFRKELMEKRFVLKRKFLSKTKKRNGYLNEEKSDDCEILSLQDQKRSLMDKIDTQTLQNRLLVKNIKKGFKPSINTQTPLPQEKKMRKPQITTLEEENKKAI